MAYEIVVTKDGVPISTTDVSDAQVKFLEHKLADVDAWLINASTFAVASKIKTCARSIVEEHSPILAADPAVATVPTDQGALVELIQARPDYKSRAQRIADEIAAREAAEAAAVG